MGHLKHPFRTCQVPKALLPEIDESGTLGKIVADQLLGRMRHQDLPAMPRGGHPRRTVHRRAVIVTGPQVGLARVQTHPHPQRLGQRPVLGPERKLRIHRRSHRAACGLANTACSPSPVVLTTTPSRFSTASRRISSWRASAPRMGSGCSCHRRVDPSRSVNRNVTVPVGSAANAIRWSSVRGQVGLPAGVRTRRSRRRTSPRRGR